MRKILYYLIYISLLSFSYNQNAEEILIYADKISYDSKNNIIAKGNSKIIKDNELIISDLIIYNKISKQITIPTSFSYKDSKGNYYSGSSGTFDNNFINAEIYDVKILLSDGTRIAGEKVSKRDKIDIINKGVYTPCISRINIKNFVCPIWQYEGEKILHDNENLFLYLKHSKMKFFNIPVFYLPYLVTPSPLRKDRKSGFLTPQLSINFIDSKTTQSASFPYYFNIDLDKDLTLTPIIKYGAGSDSSQRFLFDYNHLLSGGKLNMDVSIDTQIENQSNEDWFSNGSVITSYKQNLNENYNISIESALQTSRTYIRETKQKNKVLNNSSLSTKIDINRYGILKYDDLLHLNISTYQVVQKNQDNAVNPTVLPFIEYGYSNDLSDNTTYANNIQTYNIVRDQNTATHSQNQQKFALNTRLNNLQYLFNSKINLKTELHNQYFKTEDKIINSQSISSENYRFFPMSGIFIETPIQHNNRELMITPKISMIINDGTSNNNEISNEDSTNFNVNIASQSELNRYSGTDKLDNSKRILYGINLTSKNLSSSFSQNYEIDVTSDYNKDIGNTKHLGDAFFNNTLNYSKTIISHDVRYSPQLEKIRTQSLSLNNESKIGKFEFMYLDEKKESNSILKKSNEFLDFSYLSSKIYKYSNINIKTKYDLIDDRSDQYSIGYEYFDECFGINIDFERLQYKDDKLTPAESLSIMFSFKNLGSYKSSNLAVSETDKQDIKWLNQEIENEKFN